MPRLIRYVNVKTGKWELTGVVDPHSVQEKASAESHDEQSLVVARAYRVY
jgi:hypothetical protein